MNGEVGGCGFGFETNSFFPLISCTFSGGPCLEFTVVFVVGDTFVNMLCVLVSLSTNTG